MNPLFAGDARIAAQLVREGKVTAIYSCWGWIFICDAGSERAVAELYHVTSSLQIAGEAIVIEDTGKLQKYMYDIPEFADELMSFSEIPLVVWIAGAVNTPDRIKSETGETPFMLATDDLLAQTVHRCGKSVMVRIPEYGDPKIEQVLKAAGGIVPLQRRKTEAFQASVIRFGKGGTFQLEKRNH